MVFLGQEHNRHREEEDQNQDHNQVFPHTEPWYGTRRFPSSEAQTAVTGLNNRLAYTIDILFKRKCQV